LTRRLPTSQNLSEFFRPFRQDFRLFGEDFGVF